MSIHNTNNDDTFDTIGVIVATSGNVAADTITQITEGTTKLLVPSRSLTDTVPPKKPAFFNPKARLNRDLSVVAYAAFFKEFKGAKILLESLTGTGSRGLRVANELCKIVDYAILNDLNPAALSLAECSATLNKLDNVMFSKEEACRFLSAHSARGKRGGIVDIDPFGSPAPFLDCGIRATMHGGMLSATATDLQTLNGLANIACHRIYGGIPTRVTYGNEIAIRLILGCLNTVAGRLGTTIIPLFTESDMHYYRVYTKVLVKPDQQENTGYIIDCKICKNRKALLHVESKCAICGNPQITVAGPLWIGSIFNQQFIQNMLSAIPNLTVDKRCGSILEKCLEESDMPATYYTIDEIASREKKSPPKIVDAVHALRIAGFKASRTSFRPTGFRTDADPNQIAHVFSTIPAD